MIILAFDTAVEGCSVAVLDTASGQSFADNIVTDRRQAELLVPMIDKVMKEAGADFKKIDRIAVTVGPGSFTGVRIGLATARSMALAADKPLIGISTLVTLARQKNEGGHKTLALVDTKRNDFYGELFGPQNVSLEVARIWTPDEVAKAREEEGLVVAMGNPDPLVLARIAAEIPGIPDRCDRPSLPGPIYLREAEVGKSKRIAPVITD